ncbi:hypothetical protein LWF01_01795 [Saxibacter everestensis]|uniref:Uncharacterized protein n=1 Tax=Saxibacter everestensis TaxID=2909229 RepID=A0ABY8QU65_9MICO|nr:hypothetical protein LWF01_01795 [Brevibacteriaceae bacterium ZFBP1038]
MTNPSTLDATGDLAAATAGELRISGGAANLTIADNIKPGQLYHAHFRGLIPTVGDENGTVTVRYKRRLHPLASDQGEGSIELSAHVPWNVHVYDAAAGITATLTALTLTSLSFDSALADTALDLPTPLGAVEIRIDGPVRNLRLRRPSGVPVGVHIVGGASHIHIDGQELGAIGPGYRSTAPTSPNHYTLVIAKAADRLTVTH